MKMKLWVKQGSAESLEPPSKSTAALLMQSYGS